MIKQMLEALLLLAFLNACSVFAAEGEVLTYTGDSGPGTGKHIVFIASDHEYHAAEACPALARILAKRFGFKCTVLFGQDAAGHVRAGNNNVPGLENLKTADLIILFTRFQNWGDERMKHFVDYMDRAGPIIGLRTSTHGFKIPADSPYAKYSFNYNGADYAGGFGRQVLGEKWAGHHGANHHFSTRLDVVPEKKGHPILTGVEGAWAYCGGYKGDPLPPSEILLTAQPLMGITEGSPDHPDFVPMPAGWTRSYDSKDGGTQGRVFTLMYGASNDLANEGTRRILINASLWAMNMEDTIQPNANIDPVGPFTPTFGPHTPTAQANYKVTDLAGWDSPIPPLQPKP
jgi:hypothetical protein